MEPDWADEKARGISDRLGSFTVELIAAALREAREQGAREERRACYEEAVLANNTVIFAIPGSLCEAAKSYISARIASRGPMSEEGGGE